MATQDKHLQLGEDPESVFEGGVIRRIEDLARNHPEADALYFMDQTLSYRELDQDANRIAHGLAKLDIGPEMVAGLFLRRSPKLITGLLGILKAGAAYLPLDPAYPTDRLLFMIEDSGASVLVAERQTVNLLPELEIPILLI